MNAPRARPSTTRSLEFEGAESLASLLGMTQGRLASGH